MRALGVLLLAVGAFAAEIVDPKDCTAFPCLIFNDDFDFLDNDAWEHEVSMAGGGNFEFQAYINNRSVSYTRDSTLFIKPQLVSEWQDEEFLSTGEINLWGSQGRNDVCTGNLYSGCQRFGASGDILNPIQSARLRSQLDFSFKYGRMEVKAKMPRGDWLWPAVWLLSKRWPYGPWPASGEIDLLESRGNDDFGDLGNMYGASTLHWGPWAEKNRYDLTHCEYQTSDGTSLADGFHTWRFDWNKDGMEFYFDDEYQMTVDPGTTFWEFGGYDDMEGVDNIWNTGDKMAPFDQPFYMIINLAVGGTGGFFPDGISGTPKPWTDDSPTPRSDFWNGRSEWLPTWKQGEEGISENAALQIDYIKVWKMESVEQ